MARTARIVVPGLPMHVIQRGNNRQQCFRGAADCRRLLRSIQEQAGETGCTIHAYVLMTNHIHMLLTPPDARAIGTLMKSVLQEYTQYFNLKHQRTGSLWEGRFRSSLVQTENYFLVCQRYIELNPVRAGIVTSPADYKWSSYRSNGNGEPDPLLVPHAIYLGLGESDEARRARYRALFSTEIGEHALQHIRDAARSNGALGSTAFIEQIQQRTGRKLRSHRPGRPRKTVQS
ncbi:transposase [Pseudoduganella sp. GCM10020061]|uniref:transposase n=1 Tax=Pseudoduganella sp. GCM10020061 TaxID=3317345 RepID=UPI003634A5A4